MKYFNPIIGLILIRDNTNAYFWAFTFQSHYRSDFNTAIPIIEEGAYKISIPL